ncbi:MAG TPA: succinate dehydrogenase assembly factor 2 [Aliiroseovarius sp.]|nr:succinate dehydrogenase assembly factor 2 [Aliiroseovarius sp.]
MPEPRSETPEARLRRLQMRAARRGTKEMDLVLGPFARDRLAAMDDAGLMLFDRLLEENDNDLWLWVTRPEIVPPEYAALMDDIRAHAGLSVPVSGN